MKRNRVCKESFEVPAQQLACLKHLLRVINRKHLIVSTGSKSLYSFSSGHRRKEKRVLDRVSSSDWASHAGAQKFDQLQGPQDVRGLRFADDQSQRTTFRIRRQMQFRTQSVRGVTEYLRPAFSKSHVESWYARTIFESIRMCSISVLIAKASATGSNTRSLCQNEKRLYVLLQRPNSAGRSRHNPSTRAFGGAIWRSRRSLDAVPSRSAYMPGKVATTLLRASSLSSQLSHVRTVLHPGEKSRTYAHFCL